MNCREVLFPLQSNGNRTLANILARILFLQSKNKISGSKMYKNNINGEIYLNFIKKIINEYGNYYTLLMDNAPIHKTKKFTNYCNKNEVNVLYNIPYNPESNPIEMIFNPIKKFIKSNNTKYINTINDSINKYIKNINKETLIKMFNKSLSI